MLNALKKGVLIALLPLALMACGKDQPQQVKPVKRASKPVAPPAEEAQAVQKAPEIKPEEFSAKYRNPFLSNILVMREKVGVKKIKGPLECCNLEQFSIVAVVVSRDSGYALVMGPDKKRYIVRRGDAMGPRDGHVIKITRDGLVVREYVRDENGKIVSSQDTELDLPSKKEGNTPG